MPNITRYLAMLAAALAFLVVMLGAYTRLSNAGLGCPDWPGCYGQMVLSSNSQGMQEAQSKFPKLPLEPQKAWTEMIHRYAAGTLGLLILCLFFSASGSGEGGGMLGQSPRTLWLPLALLVLVIFQALLGMWTVTLKLLPVVVMGHLLGGLLIFAGLIRLCVQKSSLSSQDLPSGRAWLRLGVGIVFLQIALGGWVSANYAGVACLGFPLCNGLGFPPLHLAEGFDLFSPLGANYQGGLLDNEVRIGIQFVHRLGALVTVCYVLGLSLYLLLKASFKELRIAACLMIFLVLVQLILGIMNVIYWLPIQVAVAHNGVAALLLAVIFGTLSLVREKQYAN